MLYEYPLGFGNVNQISFLGRGHAYDPHHYFLHFQELCMWQGPTSMIKQR